ncbi:cytochrome c family protein [Ochrobactrum quorumnocens]|uniref:Cytochrome c family protein n=1 Tax=Ochrobactrum quorumnocens TaxID=271865 RepID=A0A248UBP5_9HYPH|nr:c-type cytochrome [[Ochrobactrum] quorumnocens]ASV84114.1 cytochrome c family protein [[Ochrobactrum] quorumnocens]
MKTTALVVLGVGFAVAVTGGAFLFNHLRPVLDAPAPVTYAVLDKDKTQINNYVIPPDRDILKEPNASEIMHGKRLLNETARLLPNNVGNGLNCNSCHIGQGKVDNVASYINSSNFYPAVMPRAGKEVDLVMRINGCFQRSMNGKPLASEGPDMSAMVAYMDWLRQGVTKGTRVAIRNAGLIDESLVPNPSDGAKIYAAQCSTCHGADGEGMKDAAGDYIFPPLWGDESFNIGAGLARTYKAAQFVKYAMPPAQNYNLPIGQGGVLTDQEAIDVSEYFTHMPRPDFAGKIKDWPNGKKPKDARY